MSDSNNCTGCSKKKTKNRVLDENGLCNECKNKIIPPTINLDLMLSELSVRDFSIWFKHELDAVIQKKVADATKDVVKELGTVKKSLKTAQADIANLTTKP